MSVIQPSMDMMSNPEWKVIDYIRKRA